jgi:hypothetical protein
LVSLDDAASLNYLWIPLEKSEASGTAVNRLWHSEPLLVDLLPESCDQMITWKDGDALNIEIVDYH